MGEDEEGTAAAPRSAHGCDSRHPRPEAADLVTRLSRRRVPRPHSPRRGVRIQGPDDPARSGSVQDRLRAGGFRCGRRGLERLGWIQDGSVRRDEVQRPCPDGGGRDRVAALGQRADRQPHELGGGQAAAHRPDRGTGAHHGHPQRRQGAGDPEPCWIARAGQGCRLRGVERKSAFAVHQGGADVGRRPALLLAGRRRGSPRGSRQGAQATDTSGPCRIWEPATRRDKWEELTMHANQQRAMTTIRLLAAVAIYMTASVPNVLSAQVGMTVPKQSQPIALRGATIHTVTQGVITNGTIIFEKGKITAVGANIAIPPGTKIVDVTGKHIYPGLIDAYSTVGISEIGAVDMSNDVNEVGDFNPNVRTDVAVNAESRHIGTSRSQGVLTTLTTPGGGLISGMSSAMAMEGWSWEEMSLESAAALNVNWPNPSQGRGGRGGGGGGGGQAGGNTSTYEGRVQQLKNYFAEARAYRDAVAAKENVRTDARYMAMIPALDRKIPVVVSANSASQINDAITWAKQENLRLIIRGGDDAIHVAARLKAENIPVILTSTMEAPNRAHEGYDAAYSRAAQLHKAGVKFAISGGAGSLYTDRLPYEAGVAVAFGLPEEEAIKAVTINAAEFMGLADRLGSLEIGKQATFLITTGTPIDMTSNILQAYIQGRELDMNDIQKHFFEKYMEKVRQKLKIIS